MSVSYTFGGVPHNPFDPTPNSGHTYVTGLNDELDLVGNYGADPSAATAFVYKAGAGGGFLPLASGFASSYATGINQYGAVVGVGLSANGNWLAFLAAGGAVQTLNYPGALSTTAAAINNAGVVVGDYTDSSQNSHGFIYNSGVWRTIDAPTADASGLNLTGVNDAGQVVGYFYNQTTISIQSFIYQNNTFTMLPDPVDGGTTIANAINDNGVVAGFYTDTQGAHHGFTYQNGDYQTVDQPGAADTYIYGVNNRGDLVGEAYYAGVGAFTDFVALAPSRQAVSFDGPAFAHILWRGAGGELSIWNMSGSEIAAAGQATLNGTIYTPGAYWKVAGVGAFDGDASCDVLWRGAGGELAIWNMKDNQIAGADQVTLNGSTYNPGTYWTVASTGDFNGDGRTDVLWRGAGGELAIWNMNNNQITGADQVTFNGSTYNPGTYWTVAGTGDFDGNGKSDVLWRGAGGELAVWNMDNNSIVGADQIAFKGSTYNPGNYWTVAGTGDFNGDGRTDVLWRGAEGELAIWNLANNQIVGADQVTSNGATYNPGAYWSVAGTGDFNSDGRTDILWRGGGGEVAVWCMNNNEIASANQVSAGGSPYNPGNYWSIAASSS